MNEDFRMFKDEEKLKNKKRQQVKAQKNIWVDTGEEQDGVDEKIVRNYKMEERERAIQKEVVCSICNRKVKVPPSLPVSTYYRCERCVGGK
jgi:DNA-directed RNA polymerase subunit RPC12/RpoP